MYVVLEVTDKDFGNVLYHKRCNNILVDVLYEEDAIIVSKIQKSFYNKESKINKKLYFLLDCKTGDKVFGGTGFNRQLYSFSSLYDANGFYIHLKSIFEMFRCLKEQNKPFPSCTEQILKENLSLLLNHPSVIKSESHEYDSSIFFLYLVQIATYIRKNINMFVTQNEVDAFFLRLIKTFNLTLFERIKDMLPGIFFTITPQILKAYTNALIQVESTKKIAAKYLSTKSYKDITWSIDGNPVCHFYIKDTPCGDIGIHIDLRFGFHPYIAISYDDYEPCVYYNIESLCVQYKGNFFDEFGKIKEDV